VARAGEHAGGRLVLPADPAAVRRARSALRESLEQAGVPPARQGDALLLLSEALTNAIKHGSREGDRVELAWTLDRDVLKVAIVDAAQGGPPVVLPPDETREQGHGMMIVDRLTDCWDQRVVGGSRRVSFRVRL
jgi:anti-sigma regulatory factor (Ser/Thr protein kinase)